MIFYIRALKFYKLAPASWINHTPLAHPLNIQTRPSKGLENLVYKPPEEWKAPRRVWEAKAGCEALMVRSVRSCGFKICHSNFGMCLPLKTTIAWWVVYPPCHHSSFVVKHHLRMSWGGSLIWGFFSRPKSQLHSGKLAWQWKKSCSFGNTSSKGPIFAMLVYQRVATPPLCIVFGKPTRKNWKTSGDLHLPSPSLLNKAGEQARYSEDVGGTTMFYRILGGKLDRKFRQKSSAVG